MAVAEMNISDDDVTKYYLQIFSELDVHFTLSPETSIYLFVQEKVHITNDLSNYGQIKGRYQLLLLSYFQLFIHSNRV